MLMSNAIENAIEKVPEWRYNESLLNHETDFLIDL